MHARCAPHDAELRLPLLSMLQCSTIDQFFDDLVSTIRRHLQAQTGLHSRKRALDVSQDVVDVLDANRQADEVVVDAQRHATLLRHRRVGHDSTESGQHM